MQRSEDSEEHFLGHVQRLFAVAEKMRGKPEDQAVMLVDQRGVCRLVTSQATFDQRRLCCGNL